MKILNKPLTIEEIKEKVDRNNYIEGVVPVSLVSIIANDHVGLLNIIHDNLVGSTQTLVDINYSIVGHLDEYTILFLVSGDVSLIIDDEQY